MSGIVATFRRPTLEPLPGTTDTRVALLAGARFPVAEPFAGGLEAQTWCLGHQLEALGARVTVFAPAGSDPTLQQVPLRGLPVRIDEGRRDLTGSEVAAKADHRAYRGAMQDLAAQSRRYDVIHNNSVHHLPLAQAAQVPLPMLTTLHTPPTPLLEAAVRAPRGLGDSTFVAVSRHTAASWAHLVGDVAVIPNGIDLAHWHEGPGGDHAVWSGRIVPEKAPHLAIDAARRAGLRLRLAGPRHDRSYWAQEVAPRLGPDVEWVGHLRGADLCREVGRSKVCLVTPDWDEPFGLVALEALASGTPVATFARGGLPEIIDESCGRSAPPSDVDALARAACDAGELDRSAARARAVEVGCASRMARAYLDAYLALA